jgi:hypothetical protein
MGKNYTQTTAALKAVTIDTAKLDAQNILIYPGEGDRNTRKNLLDVVTEKSKPLEEAISAVSQIVTDNKITVDTAIDDVKVSVNELNTTVNELNTTVDNLDTSVSELESTVETLAAKNFAYTDTSNTFNAANTFNDNVSFSGSVSLPASTTGTTGITEPTPDQILTTQDNDYRYAQLKVENTFEEVNNFEKHVNFGSSVETNGTVKVNSGGVVLSADGYVSFNDDGLVTTPSGAKGYPYSEGIPTVLSNGGVYNLGMITEPIDISGVYFDGDDTIIQTCEVWFEQGSTVNAITWMPDLHWIDTANGKAPTWIAKLRYRVAIRKEIDRLIGSLSYSYSI